MRKASFLFAMVLALIFAMPMQASSLIAPSSEVELFECDVGEVEIYKELNNTIDSEVTRFTASPVSITANTIRAVTEENLELVFKYIETDERYKPISYQDYIYYEESTNSGYNYYVLSRFRH